MRTRRFPAVDLAKNGFVFASLLLLLSPAGAQPGTPNESYQYAKFSPSLAIIVAILVAALFFMGFFSIYIRHCTEVVPSGNNSVRGRGGIGASLRRRVAPKGLDPAVIETFPTFAYSAVKGLKIGKGALECAVCINEFEDDETLRLIPKCDHVFHPECIDAWLESHVTCPVCRANLVPQPGESPQVSELYAELTDSGAETQNPPNNGEVSIRISEDHDDPIPQIPVPVRLPSQKMDRNPSMNLNPPPKSRSIGAKLFGKFPRSHSTGHSLVQPGENTDRFTLRLPVDVRKQIMSRRLNRTASCVVEMPTVGSSRRGFRTGFGEGGSSFKRIEKSDRVVKSDRWLFSMTPPFFARELSFRSPRVVAADGESSTSGSKTTTPREAKTVRFPSFKCLEPKGDEIGLVSSDSARPAV